ncbi:hypothetical protein J1N35_037539 [Gossypium stocksii]|uniref:Uncharacterized protein n=1 Tax=Gossypium stocksii TaxID=47602 RepID=A0A9D3UKQ2_9ROSI|nr:hypothetical protein J1N35_037539 [Gossypium stocksii]
MLCQCINVLVQANEDVIPNKGAITRLIVAKLSGEDLPRQQPSRSDSATSTTTFSTATTSISNSLFEQQVAITKGVGEAQLVETDPVPMGPTTAQKETKEKQEETKKMELISIVTDYEEKEANPTPAPPIDNISVVRLPSREPMTEQDHEINQIIDEINKSSIEQEDVPLQSLKRKMCYKHNAQKSTHHN